MAKEKIARRCPTCASTFYPRTNQIKAGHGKYCSRSCNFEDKNTRSALPRLLKYVQKTDTCWLWTGAADEYGYGVFYWRHRSIKAHRASYLIHGGTIPPGKILMHSCDNPPCVNPAHLSPGTRRDNMHDMIAKGREHHTSGSLRPGSKLTEADIPSIRELRASGLSYEKIGNQFGVDPKTIWCVCKGTGWKHV